MKTKPTLLALCFVFAGAVAIAADDRVTVVYNQPENFRDVKDSDTGTDKERDAILDEIKEFIVKHAPDFLPEGHTLTVTFNDIDMAGDFEPWRSSSLNDVRIMKDIYPPRMVFTFKLTDSTGAVAKEGERKLSDLFYLQNISAASSMSDPLRHEKTLFDDWLRSEFPKTKKK
jgi:hypothetical protein